MKCKNEQCDNEDLGLMMGHVDPTVYDGVIVWQCLVCDLAWPRFESDAYGRRYSAGVELAATLNSEEVAR